MIDAPAIEVRDVVFDDKVHRRFWKKVSKSLRCWEWTASKRRMGYGQFRIDGESLSAHRVSWMMANGRAVPRGMFVCHRCDNPPCVRPDHLWIGTLQDNNRDRFLKGRVFRGSDVPNSKLTIHQVRKIRQLYTYHAKNDCPSLAKMFGVSKGTIWSIISRENWKHV